MLYLAVHIYAYVYAKNYSIQFGIDMEVHCQFKWCIGLHGNVKLIPGT